jgi:hypothetical protein
MLIRRKPAQVSPFLESRNPEPKAIIDVSDITQVFEVGDIPTVLSFIATLMKREVKWQEFAKG